MKTKNYLQKLLLLWLIAAGWSSCELINPAEDIPAYLFIDGFEVAENPAISHGSTTHNITNVLVFVGGEFLGVHSLPALVPVLSDGTQEVILDPAVRRNGQVSVTEIYPFFKRVSLNATLEPGKIDTIHPVTAYKEDVRFYFIEDFELGSPIFSEDRDGDEETSLVSSNVEVFEGNRSGRIILTKDHPLVEVGTKVSELFDLAGGKVIYLEVDYKTDVDLLFGLIGHAPFNPPVSNYEFGLLPKDKWNKVYFNLTELVNLSGFEEYQLGVLSVIPIESGEFTLDEARIYLDNVKLISF